MIETAQKNGEQAGADKRRFQDYLYRAELGRLSCGSPVLKIRPTNPQGAQAHHRQVAGFIYELAAEMERRSEKFEARWVISPHAVYGRIVVEIIAEHEAANAEELVAA